MDSNSFSSYVLKPIRKKSIKLILKHTLREAYANFYFKCSSLGKIFNNMKYVQEKRIKRVYCPIYFDTIKNSTLPVTRLRIQISLFTNANLTEKNEKFIPYCCARLYFLYLN